MWYSVVISIIGGYLLGSVPVGYLVGKAWGVDVRQLGSGRTGGTNVWRATNQVLPPALTVLGDLVKGVAAVLLARALFGTELAAALAGAGAVIGHNWSVLLGWRGGAGGVTTAAALIALSPLAGAVVVPIAIAILYFSHYASLGTLAVGVGGRLVLVVLSVIDPATYPWVHVLFGAVVVLGVLWALRPNIKRLFDGSERRITLWH